MTDAVFNLDNVREDLELEAKRAGGRDGKGTLPKELWETYSAFANTDGGVILLGVEERPDHTLEVFGIEKPARVLDEFWAQLNNPQKVSRNLLDRECVTQYSTGDGRSVVEIYVPRATRRARPIYINGNPITGTFKRQHAGDYHCTEEEVRRMMAEQSEDERDARILTGFTIKDLDQECLKAYRNRLASLKPDHPYNSAEPLDFLRKVGGWRTDRISGDEGLTVAGLLMFGKLEAINEALPYYFLDYRELPIDGAKTTWVDRLTPDGTWSGNLYDFYRSVIQRLFRDLKVPFRLDGQEREDDTPVHKALREALINAIVHADYSASTSILVVKGPDYVGFRNPGLMRVSIDQALEGGQSDCRNRSLQRMFSLIGLGEQAGSGIPRVVENWKAQHYRFPELWESQEPESTLMRLRMVSLLPEETLAELRGHFGSDFDRLGENERLAVTTARVESFVSNGRVQQITRLHPRDITILLKKLVERGYLLPDGHGRATTYRVSGLEAIDLAHSTDFSTHPSASRMRSDDIPPSSDHLEASSDHLEASSDHLKTKLDPILVEIAEPVRSRGKVLPELVEATILDLCRGRFLSLSEIANLLDRKSNGVRFRFIKPMLTKGLLERRFPQQPNHERQAYRTREGGHE